MGLFGRARKMMKQGLAPPPSLEPQTYNVGCTGGHYLRGLRMEGYQAVRCPTCGEGIFVLPRSPFPPPAPPPQSKKPKPKAVPAPSETEESPIELMEPIGAEVVPRPGQFVEVGESEIDWESDSEAEAAVPPKGGGAKKDGIPVAMPPPGARPAATKPASSAPNKADPPRPNPKVKAKPKPMVAQVPHAEPPRRKRSMRPVALLLGVGGLVLATLLIQWQRGRRENLPRLAELGRTRGLEALDAGELDTARRLLSEAARAVEGLGGQYRDADRIKQAAAEVALLVDLAPKTLEEILAEADPDPASDWPRRFESLYRGQAILLETNITQAPLKSGEGVFAVDYRVFVGRAAKPSRVGTIDLKGFKLFEQTQPEIGRKVLFGGRLSAVTLDEATNQWMIQLEPESGAYITHVSALSALGWPSPAETLESDREPAEDDAPDQRKETSP